MHVSLLLIALCLCLPNARGQGAAYPPAPRLSAEQLMVYYGVASDDGEARDPGALFHQQYARGYLAGVADAGQGRQWCDTGRIKTVEIDAQVIAELKQLPVRARQGDAAILVVAILARHFPCSASPPKGG
ncbi:Rap1a/Tai family immunity protein [Janthinobacterium sp.]|uniref:Rap1a/Tai family immunity protein n=1 Tax=Janthinobacterium sp. TaxID=1871054 RepID=UPI0026018671|nr:Rap1a/Tai family immunity protein [Janthinobacterium sp.]